MKPFKLSNLRLGGAGYQVALGEGIEVGTLKRFFRENNRVKLMAENSAYAPIYTQDVRILGRLRGIIRKY